MTRVMVLARLKRAQVAAERVQGKHGADSDVKELARAVVSLTEVVAMMLEEKVR